MKTLIGCLIVALGLWFVAGCHASRYAIDDPPLVKIDPRFLGEWKIIDKADKDLYVLSRKDDYYYQLTIKEKKGDHDLPAFLSNVNGVTILNVMVPEDTGYFFFRIFDINDAGTEAKVAVVEDSGILKQQNAAQVRQYFVRHVGNPDFYKDTAIFRRISGK